MGIYQTIAERAEKQESKFSEVCERVESHFAHILISLGVDLSTDTLAKTAADSLELKVTEVAQATSPFMSDFLENVVNTPRLLAKFEQKTGLTIKNGDLMTVARAATVPPKEKDK